MMANPALEQLIQIKLGDFMRDQRIERMAVRYRHTTGRRAPGSCCGSVPLPFDPQKKSREPSMRGHHDRIAFFRTRRANNGLPGLACSDESGALHSAGVDAEKRIGRTPGDQAGG